MKNVLVIENERMIFLDIKITFANAGYNVVLATAYNIESIAESGFIPALVIADVRTAASVFKKLCRVLKHNEAYKGMPVILTNSGKPVMKRLCMRDRINVIAEVEKPYSVNDLLDIYNQYRVGQAEVHRFEAVDFQYKNFALS